MSRLLLATLLAVTGPDLAAEGLTDPAELEAFIDGVMAVHLETHHVAGATISIVKDGELFFAKGYGYADVEREKNVSAEQTLFRIGSVSKLFTWTAVMQLVEQGKLDLNEDVNSYLGTLRVPDTYPEPVTLAHLMTHTPGFEDHVIGLFARSPDRLLPLGQLLAQEMPARVRPPGQLASYSNHGTGIAAYIVEQVAGVPWAQYIEDRILKPLDMNHTTVRQPIPAELSAGMSVGYRHVGGSFEPGEFEYVPVAPAGALSASATDMAKFMIAHLQGGRYRDTRILEEATARRMQTRLFSHDPRLNGMLHGFYEMNRNGQKILGHSGDTFLFHSHMALFPEHDVGLSVSYNSLDGGKARGELFDAFLDRYYPAPERREDAAAAPRQGLQRFTGSYGAIRRSYTSLAKLAGLIFVVRISRTEDGLLSIQGPGIDPSRWIQLEPLLFREVDDKHTLTFREDDRGQITHLFLGNRPFIAFEKLPTRASPGLHYTLLGSSTVLFLSALLLWPIQAWRRRRRADAEATPSLARTARLVAWVMSALSLTFLVALAVFLREPTEIAFGIPVSVTLLLWLPVVGTILLVGCLALTLLAWRRGLWSFAGRLHYSLLSVAGLSFTWCLNYWNLLGFHY